MAALIQVETEMILSGVINNNKNKQISIYEACFSFNGCCLGSTCFLYEGN